ncbi:MAG: hypothetical protein D6815_08585, partial [Candidatus Dadabacteria bacterium]
MQTVVRVRDWRLAGRIEAFERLRCWGLALAVLGLGAAPARAAEAAGGNALFTVNNLWMMIAAALVFIMHLGFATVESGLTRAKNTTNILFKNTFVVAAGIL